MYRGLVPGTVYTGISSTSISIFCTIPAVFTGGCTALPITAQLKGYSCYACAKPKGPVASHCRCRYMMVQAVEEIELYLTWQEHCQSQCTVCSAGPDHSLAAPLRLVRDISCGGLLRMRTDSQGNGQRPKIHSCLFITSLCLVSSSDLRL